MAFFSVIILDKAKSILVNENLMQGKVSHPNQLLSEEIQILIHEDKGENVYEAICWGGSPWP